MKSLYLPLKDWCRDCDSKQPTQDGVTYDYQKCRKCLYTKFRELSITKPKEFRE